MYYAQMFDYGSHHNHVGVTGILGCMGVVFAAANHLYAIHIPDMVNSNPIGGAHFVQMVQGGEGAANPAGTLHLFVNGMQRSTSDSEARAIRAPLGNPETKVYRMMNGLPILPNGNQASPTIAALLIAGNLHLLFKHVPDDEYEAGGDPRTGRYLGQAADAPTRPNANAFNGGWNQMTPATCHIRRIH
jgi:hypothetical protein